LGLIVCFTFSYRFAIIAHHNIKFIPYEQEGGSKMEAHQIKITLKEIQEILPTLSRPEILELDRRIHEYLDTMAFSKAAESAFSEWDDPEEGIYDET
jgi:hypothetical protein